MTSTPDGLNWHVIVVFTEGKLIDKGRVPQKVVKIFLVAILLGLSTRYLWT